MLEAHFGFGPSHFISHVSFQGQLNWITSKRRIQESYLLQIENQLLIIF